MRTPIEQVRRAAVRAVVAAAAVCALTSCSFGVEELIEDIAAQAGAEVDVNLGVGRSCLPDWVNAPGSESTANQGMATAEGEVCVSAWELPRSTDLGQRVPFVTDGAELTYAAHTLMMMMAGEVPEARAAILRAGGEVGKVQRRLAEQNVQFRAYGDDHRVLLVLTADGSEKGRMSVVMGAFCERAC